MLTGGQLAGLIVAVFWAILVCFLAVVLVKLARLLGETTKIVQDLGEHTGPLLDDMTATVAQANRQLVRVDAITADIQTTTHNVSVLTTVVRSAVGGPLVKVAAFSYGVRRALRARSHGGDVRRRPRRRLTGQRPVRRRGRLKELS